MEEKNSNSLTKQIDRFLSALERMRLYEYVEHVSNRKHLLVTSFISGIARGFGFAIGFSILGAVVVVLLRYIVAEKFPGVGEFFAEVIYAVQKGH